MDVICAESILAGEVLGLALPGPAAHGPVAGANTYPQRPAFATPQCPPAFDAPAPGQTWDLPDPAQDPAGNHVICNCVSGLRGGICDAVDGGMCGRFLGDELEAAAPGSGHRNSCAGVVPVRPSPPAALACCVVPSRG